MRAGYSRKSAGKIASQLMDNPRIASELERVLAKAQAVAVGSKAEALSRIWAIGEREDESNPRISLQAYELWLKATGNLVEKREVTENQTVNIEWQTPIPEDGDEG